MITGKVKRLSLDKAFGILTRNGLEEKLRKVKREFSFLFVDFEHVHFMNQFFGYEAVNSIFRYIFDNFSVRKKDIIGRWFSGDEILIITFDGYINGLLKRLEKRCKKYNVKFKYIIVEKTTKENMYSILRKL